MKESTLIMVKYYILSFIVISFLLQNKDFFMDTQIEYETASKYDPNNLSILKDGERYWWQKSATYQKR